jgi:anti-sigma factor RsiW
VNVRTSHLHEDRLVDGYFAERRGERLDPPIAEHLADCARCRDRYADLQQTMNALADDASAEFDEVFPADRLREQRQAISRRLEHVGHVARVLTFPARLANRHINASASRGAHRWIAGAAAAGLFVGVAAGMFFDSRLPRSSVFHSASTHQTVVPAHGAGRLTAVATDGRTTPTIDADEYFMSDLESALDRPRTRELLAFDALTPHVREIRDVQ